jgi:hypothetical protein
MNTVSYRRILRFFHDTVAAGQFAGRGLLQTQKAVASTPPVEIAGLC